MTPCIFTPEWGQLHPDGFLSRAHPPRCGIAVICPADSLPSCCLAMARVWPGPALYSQFKCYCGEAAGEGCTSSHEWMRGGVSTLVGKVTLSSRLFSSVGVVSALNGQGLPTKSHCSSMFPSEEKKNLSAAQNISKTNKKTLKTGLLISWYPVYVH